VVIGPILVAPLLLAATVAVPVPDAPAFIPVPDAVKRFPDPSYWPGTGALQVGNMLDAVASDCVSAMLGAGPGPGQLAARFSGGELDEAHRVAILLCGAHFHDPVLLPAYAEAFRSSSERERVAAAVGIAILMGDPAPLPVIVPDAPEYWQAMERAALEIHEASRSRTLVGIWVDSYLVARGLQPFRPGLVIPRGREGCLRAIREVARPPDLNEVAALWPLLDDLAEQLSVIRTIELITGRPIVQEPRGQRVPRGEFLHRSAVNSVEFWVQGHCRTVDGLAAFEDFLARGHGTGRVEALLAVLRLRHAVAWPSAMDELVPFGAPAVYFDRQRPGSPGNEESVRQVRNYFPISWRAVREQERHERR
jgi:hypothetical protein